MNEPPPHPERVAKLADHRVAVAIIGVAIAVAAVQAAALLSSVLLLVFAGILVAVGLRGSADALAARTSLAPRYALAVVALLLVALLVGFGMWVGPRLGHEAPALWDSVTEQWSALKDRAEQINWLQPVVERFDSMDPSLRRIGGHVIGYASTTLGILGSVVVVVFTGIYLAADPGLYRRGTIRLVPRGKRERATVILDETGRTLKLWLLGRLIDMVAVTAMTFAGLWLLGMPLALSLAVVAGILNFVPYIGAVAGAVPAILVALGQGPNEALWVAGLFFVIQTIEGYLLSPAIQSRTVDVPPAITILSQTIFGTLFGFMGLILAPALAAVTQVLVRMIYVEDVLGDRRSEREG